MKLRRKSELTLRVNALRGSDLFLLNQTSRSKTINLAVVARLNLYKKRSRRKLNTSNPSWDDLFDIPLRAGDKSELLIVEVWNRTPRTRLYLGEVRFMVSDIFMVGEESDEGDPKFAWKTEPKWFRLHTNEAQHSYVTGSILLLFELLCEKKTAAANTTPQNPRILVTASTDLDNGLEALEVADPTQVAFLNWQESLLGAETAESLVQPDAQGFLTLVADPLDVSACSGASDFELATDGASVEQNSGENPRPTAPHFLLDRQLNTLKSELMKDRGSGSGTGSASEDWTEDSDALSANFSGDEGKRKRRGRRKKNAAAAYELRNRKVKGVLFLEIASCLDLPPLKNFMRTSFDMDPFVVVTFGKKTFRTSWKRHTLNPVWNERLAFEVMEHAANYNIQFSVLDKDHFSFHDQVADISIPVRDLIRISTASPVNGASPAPGSQGKASDTPTTIPAIPATAPSQAEVERTSQQATSTGANASITQENGWASLSIVTPSKSPSSQNSTAQNSNSQNSNSKILNSEEGDKDSQTVVSLSSSSKSLTSLKSDNNPSGIKFADDADRVKIHKKKFIRRRTTYQYVDTLLFKTLDLALNLHDKAQEGTPTLKLRARFVDYETLRCEFWALLLDQYTVTDSGKLDSMELIALLDTMGCAASDEVVQRYFDKTEKSFWTESLSHDEVIECLENHVNTGNETTKLFEIERCPICFQQRFGTSTDIDIVTHVAICASKDWSIVNKLLVLNYVTPQIATRRWFSKVLMKITYGKYKLGGNSANILVQDRSTGIILEEKMSVTVRLGIRLLYKGLDRAKRKRIRTLLRRLSVKQGAKFDDPALKRDIELFIRFHKLDLSECQVSDFREFKTFNDFFYRKLKPDARPVESPDEERVAVSPADCRCTTFATVDLATSLWIKGRNFSVAKLFNGNFNGLELSALYDPKNCCIGIFRLAPQDYHRFHSPVTGTIGPIKYIEGEYYTVNPMAIRSALDVYGENVRVIVPIQTEHFGTVVLVAVGAMMVGSTVITVDEGQKVNRGDEVGYFKFGGSTVLLLFEKSNFAFDSDLIDNSSACVETLVQVGQSIGHRPEIPEHKRVHLEFSKQPKNLKVKLIRVITGGDLHSAENRSWESKNLALPKSAALLVDDEDDDEDEDEDYDSATRHGYDEDDESFDSEDEDE